MSHINNLSIISSTICEIIIALSQGDINALAKISDKFLLFATDLEKDKSTDMLVSKLFSFTNPTNLFNDSFVTSLLSGQKPINPIADQLIALLSGQKPINPIADQLTAMLLPLLVKQ